MGGNFHYEKRQNNGKNNIGVNNIGNYNIGGDNTGVGNIGNKNTGEDNIGARNVGGFNVGGNNNGDGNYGDNNNGNFNQGGKNNGDENVGESNFGIRNVGDCNVGSGNYGGQNIGSYNIGEFNLTDYVVGYFNTTPQTLIFFNKPSNWTPEQWMYSQARRKLRLLISAPTQWIDRDEMTDAEKQEHPEYATTNGYVKILTQEERFAQNVRNWNALSEEDKRVVMVIPNFDKEIFKQITGIDADAEPQ